MGDRGEKNKKLQYNAQKEKPCEVKKSLRMAFLTLYYDSEDFSIESFE